MFTIFIFPVLVHSTYGHEQIQDQFLKFSFLSQEETFRHQKKFHVTGRIYCHGKDFLSQETFLVTGRNFFSHERKYSRRKKLLVTGRIFCYRMNFLSWEDFLVIGRISCHKKNFLIHEETSSHRK